MRRCAEVYATFPLAITTLVAPCSRRRDRSTPDTSLPVELRPERPRTCCASMSDFDQYR